VFHNHCVKTSFRGFSTSTVENHISSEQLAVEFGMCDGISGYYHLGHVARMGGNHLPKQLLSNSMIVLFK